VAAGVGTAAWELTHQPGVPFDGAFFFHELGPSTSDLGRVSRELVGVFGSVDVGLPGPARLAWMVLVGAVVIGALASGTARQRIVVATAVVAVVVVTLLVSSALLRQNGFQVQGRHVLAFVVLVPLLAGEVLHANHRAGPRRWLRPGVTVGVVAAVAVAIHLVGLKANVDHYAGTPDEVAARPSLPAR
jgi:hypothetical protein